MNPSQVTNVFTFSARQRHGVVQKPTDAKGLTLEAWSSGFLVGAFVIMGCITIANMRRGVLLHKVKVPNNYRSYDADSTSSLFFLRYVTSMIVCTMIFF